MAIELARWPISCQSPVNQILVGPHIWGTSSAAERSSRDRQVGGSMPRVGNPTFSQKMVRRPQIIHLGT